ncbi:response regulator transcription factor [candidate division WOR-3 bacterium]|nr:response regulator transcription factor [candidate division WOR-3 bacterium]
MSIKILIADEHKIFREGLSTLIEKEMDMEVVGEAGNGREAIKLAQELSPDIILMDITMPELNGIEATRKIISKYPGIKVIALSFHSDRRFVLGMIDAGACGYLLKECAFEELVRAIHTVIRNKTYLSPGISDILVEEYVNKSKKEKHPVFSKLTSREREILQLIAEGKGTKEIARELYISVKTVETHRRNIKGKLGTKSIAEMTKYAIREGITSLEL